MDVELIRCLIERKAEVAPRLKFIFLYYLEEMTEPEGLYDLADKHGMRLNALYRLGFFFYHALLSPPRPSLPAPRGELSKR